MIDSNLLATVASIASEKGLKVEITSTQIILVPSSSEAPATASEAPATSTESEDKSKGKIVANYRNGNVFRAWNLKHFSKEERKTLQMFALLFNDGFHAYQIKAMTGLPHLSLEEIARGYRFTALRRCVVESLRTYTVGLIARLKAI
jgi:hypothetical protein